MSTPYYQDDAVTLYHSDWRELIPACFIADLIVTDPPYGETSLDWDRWPDGWPELAARHARSMWCFGSMRMFLDRAQGRCECTGECGRPDDHLDNTGRCVNHHLQPAYGTGSKVILTVAHLNHTPEDCCPENLRAMCQGCHLHYDRQHHAETAAATRRADLEAHGQQVIEL